MEALRIALAISVISLLLSLSSIFYVYSINLELDNKMSAISSNLNLSISNTNAKIEIINNTIGENSDKINENSIRINNLEYKFNNTIVSQQNEIQNLTEDLEKYNSELSDKLSWISSDASIENFPEYNTERDLLNKCVSTEINLGCVWYIIHDKLGFKYINDTNFNTSDTLFNLSEIYEHRGGDCEDLSLLFSASIRYLMNKYGIYDFNAWKPGNNKYIIYSTSNGEYYIPNANEFHFSAKYVYITCFGLNEIIDNHKIGHCIVSFCKNKIVNYEDLYNCTNIEPQEYGKLTDIGPGPIWLYISSSDLCMPVDNKTKCFSDFKNSINQILS